MNHGLLLWICAAATAMPLFIVPRILKEVSRDERTKLRMWQVQRSISAHAGDVEEPPMSSQGVLLELLGSLGRAMISSGIIAQSTLNELQETLVDSRLTGTRGLSIFLGIKLMLVIGVPLVVIALGGEAGTSSGSLLSMAAVAGILGLLAPDYALKNFRKRYLKQVEAGLADALDLLVICAEAGLGLEPAIERVSEEIVTAHRAVAQELKRTAHDMRMIADRKTALLNMGKRTGLESMERLATTLVQATQLGTPLTKALRTISAELRQEAMTRFEARAARLPVLLTLPMIVFILPCVFIVVGGPAGLQVMRTLHH